jgi:hypothetical protein
LRSARARASVTFATSSVAPPLSLGALEREILAASARGLVLVDPGSVARFVASGSLARAFVFAPRGQKAKLRLDRVQDARVRANGRAPISFKELLRRARTSVRASSDDGKKLAAALVRAWETSDVELVLPQKPMT